MIISACILFQQNKLSNNNENKIRKFLDYECNGAVVVVRAIASIAIIHCNIYCIHFCTKMQQQQTKKHDKHRTDREIYRG